MHCSFLLKNRGEFFRTNDRKRIFVSLTLEAENDEIAETHNSTVAL